MKIKRDPIFPFMNKKICFANFSGCKTSIKMKNSRSVCDLKFIDNCITITVRWVCSVVTRAVIIQLTRSIYVAKFKIALRPRVLHQLIFFNRQNVPKKYFHILLVQKKRRFPFGFQDSTLKTAPRGGSRKTRNSPIVLDLF